MFEDVFVSGGLGKNLVEFIANPAVLASAERQDVTVNLVAPVASVGLA